MNFRSPAVILKLGLLALLLMSASRLALSWYYFDRIGSLADLGYMLLQGVRVDLIVVGALFAIPLLISLWLSDGPVSKAAVTVVKGWLYVAFAAIVFMEVVTPQFIVEYDLRPNRLFIDYLIYPAEVFSMLWQGYKLVMFLSLASIALAIIGARYFLQQFSAHVVTASVVQRVALTVLVLFVSALAVRSSLQHRPFNPSLAYFSSDNLVNSLMLDSTYSVMYALYNEGAEKQAADLYGKMAERDIIAKVRAAADDGVDPYVSDEEPTLHRHQASFEGAPRNIVILLQESLGARYVGALGGKDLTPKLDALMKEGWYFTNAYSTGTRSVRGIEAVFTGFSPGPSRSTVKLSKSQSGFFNLAALLKRHSYFTQFMYGGESHFDNMKSFFLGNGVDDIHDLPTFENPRFVGSWGASDEDLYIEADKQFTALHKTGKPFFSLVFSTSNHSPWEYPEGCEASYVSAEHSRETAVQYADCALGDFIRVAQKSAYWDDTIFLIVADHDSRVSGADMVPIDHFRIPALILGGGITPHEDARLVSQMDLPVTLLSLAGISDETPMLGFDMTTDVPVSKQRAMLQYGENFAWLTPNHAVVLRPGLPATVFTHDGKHLLEQLDKSGYAELIDVARANVLWSNLAYEKHYYRLPESQALEHESRACNAGTPQEEVPCG